MTIDTLCPHERVKHFGAWSMWPFYEATPEYYRTGALNVLHHKEYHKNGVVFRKIRGQWVKYRDDAKSLYFTR